MSTGTKRRWWPLAAVIAVVAVAMWAPAYAGAANVTAHVSVVDSHGNGIAGVPIHYGSPNGGWYYLGTTDGNGLATGDAPATTQFLAEYNQGGAVSDQVDASLPYTFHTVPVKLLNTTPLIYATNGNSGWHTYTGPMEMFPGSYLINNGHGNVALTVGSSGFTGAIVRLVDHSGNGLPGGAIESYPPWASVPGTTDANGNLLAELLDSSSLNVAMYYAGTRNQQSHAQLDASNFTFQTALVVVKLKDADGNPLDTGNTAYYAGGWQPGQSTSGGETSFEMLPGSYSFAMDYNHTRQQLDGVAISGPTTDVVFQTGRLTAYFSQPFSWYNSQFYPFATQSLEFLPGQVGLALAGCNTPKFSIAAGDHLVKTGIVATLADSANHPLAGGIASAYAGGWKSVGTTGANGKTCVALDGHLGNTAVAMVYNGTRQQISQNAQTNAVYPFKTTAVTVELRNSTGGLIDTGSASYYAGGWRTIGDTSGGTTTVQMLPGSYAFAMTYLGTREQLNGQAISGTTDTVTFQTGKVVSGGTATSYYAGSWRPFTNGMELLPGTYWFGFSDVPNAQYTLVGGTTNTIH